MDQVHNCAIEFNYLTKESGRLKVGGSWLATIRGEETLAINQIREKE